MEVAVNAVHPGTVKTGIIRDHEGLLAGKIPAMFMTAV